MISESARPPERFPPTRVSVKGQTVVPRGIRRLLNIVPGSQLRWEVRGPMILVYPIGPDPLGASVGALKGRRVRLSAFLGGRHRARS